MNSILIVDDEPLNISLISQILSGEYDLYVATSGQRALDLLRQHRIDLMLLDVMMPEMDGFEVASRMLSDPHITPVPFIFLTAQSNIESVIRGFNAGAIDYIVKPFSKEELLVRVSTHLKIHALQRELEVERKRLQKLFDLQKNIIIVTDGETFKIANRSLIDFFGYHSIEEFRENTVCICHRFVPQNEQFHLGLVPADMKWVDYLRSLPSEKRIVSMKNAKGELHAFNVTINTFEDEDYILSFSDITATIALQNALRDETMIDPLTKAYNRNFFDSHIDLLLKTHNGGLGIIIFDIDHFKRVNDTYGHDIGDKTLKEVVRQVKKSIRKDDQLIRWGGEEFIVIIVTHSQILLEGVAENLRRQIETTAFEAIGALTCSFGVTLHRKNELITQTVKRADEALYAAKEGGRNRTVLI